MNNTGERFALFVEQKEIFSKIFDNKKTKQRYLDYMFKIGFKRFLVQLDNQCKLRLKEINNIYIFMDEHSTATNGKYELKESLLTEYKHGTFKYDYSDLIYPPITVNLNSVHVTYLDSKNSKHIRAADIIANKIYRRLNQLEGNDDLLNHKIKVENDIVIVNVSK